MSYHQTIYNLLRGYGLSEAGALGMLGNWECESGCEPYRVQGDYQASRTLSKDYVNRIKTGRMTKEQFATDQRGFGEAQWTYPQRKRNLWDHALQMMQPIDSVELQVDFAMWELQKPEWSGDSELFSLLKTSNDIYTCTDRICRKYERPAVNNVQARYEAALRIRAEIDLSGSTNDQLTPVNPQKPEEKPKKDAWYPRTIDGHCSEWDEVWLLQVLLNCHGYGILVDGVWGILLTDKVRQFQSENGLEADGVGAVVEHQHVQPAVGHVDGRGRLGIVEQVRGGGVDEGEGGLGGIQGVEQVVLDVVVVAEVDAAHRGVEHAVLDGVQGEGLVV